MKTQNEAQELIRKMNESVKHEVDNRKSSNKSACSGATGCPRNADQGRDAVVSRVPATDDVLPCPFCGEFPVPDYHGYAHKIIHARDCLMTIQRSGNTVQHINDAYLDNWNKRHGNLI